MVQLQGDRDLAQAPGKLWPKVSDARFLVRCIPDVESVSRSEPDTAIFVLRPGVSFVRGTLAVTLHIVEARAQEFLRLQAHSKGIGTTSAVEATLTLTPQTAGTRVHWTADIQQLGGLLKMVPQGLVQASAQKVIADIWEELVARLGAE